MTVPVFSSRRSASVRLAVIDVRDDREVADVRVRRRPWRPGASNTCRPGSSAHGRRARRPARRRRRAASSPEVASHASAREARRRHVDPHVLCVDVAHTARYIVVLTRWHSRSRRWLVCQCVASVQSRECRAVGGAARVEHGCGVREADRHGGSASRAVDGRPPALNAGRPGARSSGCTSRVRPRGSVCPRSPGRAGGGRGT